VSTRPGVLLAIPGTLKAGFGRGLKGRPLGRQSFSSSVSLEGEPVHEEDVPEQLDELPLAAKAVRSPQEQGCPRGCG
jgi:hypothetical protein